LLLLLFQTLLEKLWEPTGIDRRPRRRGSVAPAGPGCSPL
jgi:hypothetical protein